MGPIGDSFATPVSSQTHGALSSEPQKATIKKLSLLPSKKPEDDAFRTVSKPDLKVNRNEGLRSYRFWLDGFCNLGHSHSQSHGFVFNVFMFFSKYTHSDPYGSECSDSPSLEIQKILQHLTPKINAHSRYIFWIRAEKRPHDPHLMFSFCSHKANIQWIYCIQMDVLFFLGVVPRKIPEDVPVFNPFVQQDSRKNPRLLARSRKASAQKNQTTGDVTLRPWKNGRPEMVKWDSWKIC